MSFTIRGLDPAPFANWFDLSDDALARREMCRVMADSDVGYPDRITLRDVPVGTPLILLNYQHQPAATPYKATGPIFVSRGQGEALELQGEVPAVFARRVMSLRAYDTTGMMNAAEVVEGEQLEDAIERLLGDPQTAYLHAHYAQRGCYAGHIERA